MNQTNPIRPRRPTGRGRTLAMFAGCLAAISLASAQGLRADTQIDVPPVGDSCANGEALRQAIAAIDDAGPRNTYTLQLSAAVYELCGGVGDGLRMKEWVSLAGAGRYSTVVEGPGGAPPTHPSLIPEGTFRGASNMEIRDLTLQTLSLSTYNIALSNDSGASPTVRRVYILVRNGIANTGVRNYDGARPFLEDLQIDVSGGSFTYGLVNRYKSAPALSGVSISATAATDVNYGIYTAASTDPLGVPEDFGALVGRGTIRGLEVFASGGVAAYGIADHGGWYDGSATPWAHIVGGVVYGDTSRTVGSRGPPHRRPGWRCAARRGATWRCR